MKTYDPSGFCTYAAIRHSDSADSPLALLPFLRLPRELRDTIYEHHIEDQVSGSNLSSRHGRRRTCCWCSDLAERSRSTETWYSFPLLHVNRQLMHELQQTLVKKDFTLKFDCTHHLLQFLESSMLYPIQKQLTRLRFHWRGSIYGPNDEPQVALGRLQTLPALKHLTVKITNSLPLPERARYLEEKGFTGASRDFCFTVAEAIGFDELCSVRGLSSVRLDVNYSLPGGRTLDSAQVEPL